MDMVPRWVSTTTMLSVNLSSFLFVRESGYNNNIGFILIAMANGTKPKPKLNEYNITKYWDWQIQRFP